MPAANLTNQNFNSAKKVKVELRKEKEKIPIETIQKSRKYQQTQNQNQNQKSCFSRPPLIKRRSFIVIEVAIPVLLKGHQIEKKEFKKEEKNEKNRGGEINFM